LTLKITKYGTEYQDAVVELWRKCNLVVPKNDPMEDIEKKRNFQPNLFFIGPLDGKVTCPIMVDYEGHRCWINYLAVAHENQRHEYGRKLVQKAIETSSLPCCTFIWKTKCFNKTGTMTFMCHSQNTTRYLS
jgi:hypothetical protein